MSRVSAGQDQESALRLVARVPRGGFGTEWRAMTHHRLGSGAWARLVGKLLPASFVHMHVDNTFPGG